MSEPFALCPVHDGLSETFRIAEVQPGKVIIAGRVEAVTEFFTALDLDFRDGSFRYARPEIPADHPAQMLLCSALPGGDGDWSEEFGTFGDGGFIIPPHSVIERNLAGEVCCHIPGTARHTLLSPQPLSNLN